MLYQAKRGGTPLVVIAGESGVKYEAFDAQMAADLVSIARPVTKWATRVTDPGRSCACSVGPSRSPAPPRPVRSSWPCPRTSSTRSTRSPSCRRPYRRRGRSRRRPGPRGGDAPGRRRPPDHHHGRRDRHVRRPGGATHVAELLGADVWGANSSEVNIDDAPALQGQPRPRVRPHSGPLVAQADAVLIVGTYVFPEVLSVAHRRLRPGGPDRPHDLDAYEIAKGFPVDLGLVGDPRLTLAALAVVLGQRGASASREAADARIEARRGSATRPMWRRATPTSRRARRSRCTPRSSWRRWRLVCPRTRSSWTRH